MIVGLWILKYKLHFVSRVDFGLWLYDTPKYVLRPYFIQIDNPNDEDLICHFVFRKKRHFTEIGLNHHVTIGDMSGLYICYYFA